MHSHLTPMLAEQHTTELRAVADRRRVHGGDRQNTNARLPRPTAFLRVFFGRRTGQAVSGGTQAGLL